MSTSDVPNQSNQPQLPTREELVDALAKAKAEVASLRAKSEKLGVTFKRIPEKGDAQRLRDNAMIPILEPMPELSVIQDPSMTDHVMIEADNLTALTVLSTLKDEFVDVHYIDPPYNTGNDGADGGFVYNDRFISSEDPAHHSAWLSFMMRRLVLLQRTLRETGVILVAIGDDEEAYLRLLLDQVFGEGNFVARINWAGSIKNDARFVSNTSDYMFVYAKSKDKLFEKDVRWRATKSGVEEMLAKAEDIWSVQEALNTDLTKEERAALATKEFAQWFKSLEKDHPAKQLEGNKMYLRIDEKGRVYRTSDLSWPGGGGPTYDVLHPITKLPVQVPSRGWSAKPDTMDKWLEEGRILFGKDHTVQAQYKRFLHETKDIVLRDVITTERPAATKELAALIGRKPDGKPIFNNPKDINVLAQWIDYVTPSFRKAESSEDPIIVCDVFAGSGSTGHAVFKLNQQNPSVVRRVFLVTNNEDPAAQDPDADSGVARDVTIVRLEAALTGVWADGKSRPSIPGNLHYYRLGWVHLNDNGYDDPTHQADIMQDRFAGLVAVSKNSNHVLPLNEPDCGKRYVILSNGAGDINVVWMSYDDTFFSEGYMHEVMDQIVAQYPAQRYTICVPAAGEDADFSHTDWQVETFPCTYIRKLRAVVKTHLKSNNLLEPYAPQVTSAPIDESIS